MLTSYATLGLILLVSFIGSILGAYLYLHRKSFATREQVAQLADSFGKIEASLQKDSVKDLGAWRNEDWLNYYSACREFLLSLGAKFVMLMTQASVYASAACAAMLALHREFTGSEMPQEIYLVLSGPLVLPLVVYWYFLVRYFYQTRETGSLMKDVEASFLLLPPKLRLLTRLREVRTARLYGSRITVAFVWLYPPLLAFAIFTIGYCLSYGLPPWLSQKPI